MAKRKSRLKPDVEGRIGYRFRNPEFLVEALTHASARTPARGFDNQRLEFLGDRVLGLAVAELLFEHFPDAREGQLARRFNALVHTKSCARVARDLDLGSALILDAGEAAAGGRRKESILADACEALLGAIFLDGGFEAARNVARMLWTPHLDAAAPPQIDAKTALQEWAQARKLTLPHYATLKSEGPDHAPSFTVEARIEGLEPARGQGATKKTAEQAAAAALLMREGVWSAA